MWGLKWGDKKYSSVCKRPKLPVRGVHSEVREIGRGGVRDVVTDRQGWSQRCCDRMLTVCVLFWFGPVTNEELEEEFAYDHICVL